MFSNEEKVLPGSEYYIYTPSLTGRKLYFVPSSCGSYRYDSGYALDRSSFHEYLLFYIEEGSCIFQIQSDSYLVSAGEAVFVCCHEPHSYYTVKGCTAKWIHFDGPLAKAVYRALNARSAPVFPLETPQNFLEPFTEIFNIFRENRPIKEVLMNQWITGILTELTLSREHENGLFSSTISMEELISYIYSNLNQDLSPEALAGKMSMNPYSFSKMFRRETGYSPHDFVIEARLGTARYLLKSTNSTVREIALQVGFHMESSFCTTFKNRLGITPSEYRLSLDSEKQADPQDSKPM